ncbi:hypothetical protein, partial [Bacteroides acidifaciens]|uniref:hypothetical protein n=2 Tax=Bacteroides acidifaciens TaxID=85831 RepID=UPI001C3F8B92
KIQDFIFVGCPVTKLQKFSTGLYQNSLEGKMPAVWQQEKTHYNYYLGVYLSKWRLKAYIFL